MTVHDEEGPHYIEMLIVDLIEPDAVTLRIRI
jgi:hypothetical protein